MKQLPNNPRGGAFLQHYPKKTYRCFVLQKLQLSVAPTEEEHVEIDEEKAPNPVPVNFREESNARTGKKYYVPQRIYATLNLVTDIALPFMPQQDIFLKIFPFEEVKLQYISYDVNQDHFICASENVDYLQVDKRSIENSLKMYRRPLAREEEFGVIKKQYGWKLNNPEILTQDFAKRLEWLGININVFDVLK